MSLPFVYLTFLSWVKKNKYENILCSCVGRTLFRKIKQCKRPRYVWVGIFICYREVPRTCQWWHFSWALKGVRTETCGWSPEGRTSKHRCWLEQADFSEEGAGRQCDLWGRGKGKEVESCEGQSCQPKGHFLAHFSLRGFVRFFVLEQNSSAGAEINSFWLLSQWIILPRKVLSDI